MTSLHLLKPIISNSLLHILRKKISKDNTYGVKKVPRLYIRVAGLPYRSIQIPSLVMLTQKLCVLFILFIIFSLTRTHSSLHGFPFFVCHHSVRQICLSVQDWPKITHQASTAKSRSKTRSQSNLYHNALFPNGSVTYINQRLR